MFGVRMLPEVTYHRARLLVVFLCVSTCVQFAILAAVAVTAAIHSPREGAVRLTCDRTELLAACAAALPFAPEGRGVLAALPGACSVSASDPGGGCGASTAVPSAEVAEPGTVGVDLAFLADWLRQASTDRVVLIVGATGPARVIGGESERSEFATHPPETHAAPPAFGPHALAADGAAFRRALERVAFAVPSTRDAGRSKLRSVQFHVEGATLTLCATDSLGFATATLPVTGNHPSCSMAVPVDRVRGWAALAGGPVALDLSGSVGLFGCGPAAAWTALCDYVPKRHAVATPHGADLPAPAVLRAVRMALAASDDEVADFDAPPTFRIVRVAVAAGGGVTVRGSKPGHTLSAVEVPGAGYDGGPFAVDLDGFQLGRFLAAVKREPVVRFAWLTAERPVRWAVPGAEYVMCPQRA